MSRLGRFSAFAPRRKPAVGLFAQERTPRTVTMGGLRTSPIDAIDAAAAHVEEAGMITVHTAPAVELNPQHGWEITFWVADAFDYSFPFRDTLREIAEYLGVENVANGLPPYDRDEDFVDGSVLFGQSEVGVYFEHALGYLMLYSPERDVLDRLATIIFPNVILKERPMTA